MPSLQKLLLVFIDQMLDTADLVRPKPSTCLQAYRAKPEFRYFALSFNMNVRRLRTVACVKEETIRPYTLDGRHDVYLFEHRIM